MRFILFIISMLLLAGCGNSIGVTDLREGDVVFIESQSSQAPYIKFDNGKMYCSELVWLVYKEQGIELCKPRKVSSFPFARIPKVRKLMDKRGISMDQHAVAPVDLYKAIS